MFFSLSISSVSSLIQCFLLQIKVPVIVVGCKLDLRDDRQPSLEQVMAPLMHEFREIETCIECSAIKQIQVLRNFSLKFIPFITGDVSCIVSSETQSIVRCSGF